MKKLMKSALLFGAVMAGTSTFAQIQDEENVTITMELVPILQLNMNTPNQVNFVFDEISEYLGGITQYGATILTSSSTVSWDLFASGTSADHQATAGASPFWDVQLAYGAGVNGTDSIPLRALEMHQYPSDINNAVPATDGDYAAIFVPANGTPAFGSNVYVSGDGNPYTAPPGTAGEDRYIAGGDGSTSYVAGGSYLTQGTVAAIGAADAYYFVIDYRIVPSLPAIFPFASDGTGAAGDIVTGAYATTGNEFGRPGVYTMNVKYLMIENQ